MFRFFIKLIFDLKAEEQRRPLVLIQSFAAMMQRNRQMMPGQENVTTVPPFPCDAISYKQIPVVCNFANDTKDFWYRLIEGGVVALQECYGLRSTIETRD